MATNSSRIDQADQLRHALAFVRRGHKVLPLHWPIRVNGRMVCSCKKAADCGKNSAKHPYGRLVSRGLLDASTDETVIRKWWADTPQANLGVVTDKLVVLDIDPRHNGDSSLAALERDHDFPPTWRALTGGGGEHIIFAASPMSRLDRLGPLTTRCLVPASIFERAAATSSRRRRDTYPAAPTLGASITIPPKSRSLKPLAGWSRL